MNITIIILYVFLPLIVIVGVMYLIRRKREKNIDKSTNKFSDIKAEESKNKE